MRFTIEAACGCHMGKVRKNNEDNFYFGGKCLESDNEGLKNPACLEESVRRGLSYAVFDGMGGENFGEIAAYTAARKMQQIERTLADFFIPERKYLTRLVMQLNDAVVQAKKEMHTDRMGTTMVSLYFSGRYVYVCNIGDSRAYRLRNGEFMQISQDHVEQNPGRIRKKAPLTQHLGIDPEDMIIEPYIAKGILRSGDIYLLCSDGLTDMLSNLEISCLLHDYPDVDECVSQLIQAALDKGGRDNITVIVCKINR